MNANDIRPMIKALFGIAAMVCAGVALAKLGGLRFASGGVIEWAAVAIACAHVR